jgi:hypothetical protein
MTFIPTFCDGCARSALVEEELIREAVSVCASCGGAARVVPGSSFRREDVLPFEALAKALRDAAIGQLNAAQLLEDIADPRYATPGSMLRHLAKALPSLAFLEMSVQGGPEAMRKVEEMLRALLRGLASRCRPSGFIASTGHDRSRKSG